MSYKVEAWPWCADYCKKNKHSPYDSYFWDKAMLEYRRQHNIFEVGDYILTNDDASNGKVYEIEKNHFNEHFKIRSKDGFRYCRIWRIERHATDSEIAAGKRLEVGCE